MKTAVAGKTRDDKTPHQGRPHIGMLFKCCNVYAHILLNASGTAYVGHCPQCAAAVRIDVGPGGSDQRIWSAD